VVDNALLSVEPVQTVGGADPDKTSFILREGPHGIVRQALLIRDAPDDDIHAGDAGSLGCPF
jgi:hypothetical protein